MPKRMPLSFKNTDLEQRLLKFLEEKSALIGSSAYLKQLLYEQMVREGYNIKDEGLNKK